jgi:hypothetical protein
MKQTVNSKRKSSPTVEPVFISRLQRTTAAQIARERALASWRQRASRLVLNAVVAAVALRVLTVALQPCLAAYRSARAIQQLQGQLHREWERGQHLKSQIAFLNTDRGVEEEARKLGWTRPGEVSLQIITPEPRPAAKKEGAAARASTATLPSHVSGSERLRLAITQWLERWSK